jgi:hypothetical protein
MGDAVTSQVLADSPGFTTMLFTNLSDGTGESEIVKVNVSDLTIPCAYVEIVGIDHDIRGMSVAIEWAATTNVVAYICGGHGDHTFSAPIRNNSGAGITGDIAFTTAAHTAGDSYSIVLYLRKKTAV